MSARSSGSIVIGMRAEPASPRSVQLVLLLLLFEVRLLADPGLAAEVKVIECTEFIPEGCNQFPYVLQFLYE